MRSPLGRLCLTSCEGVTKRESHLTHKGNPYWLVEPPPAARQKLAEEGAMQAKHYRRRAHRRARAGSNCLGGSCVMAFGESREIAADIGKRRLGQHPTRHCCEYAVRVQQLARKEQPVSFGVPGEIAKYTGELQCPAEFCSNPLACWRRLATNPHRDPPNRDSPALAKRHRRDRRPGARAVQRNRRPLSEVGR